MTVNGCNDLLMIKRRQTFILAVCMNFLMVSYVYFRIYANHLTESSRKIHMISMEKQAQDIHKLLRPSTEALDLPPALGTGPSSSYRKLPLTLTPQCDNILNNMTGGKWVKKVNLPRYQRQIQRLIKEEERLESELRIFWVKRGIQTAFWRKDFRCGYYNYESQPYHTTWPRVGSWCNPKSDRPCCTNKIKGFCAEPSQASCNCTGCIDMRSFKYADVSEWIVTDRRCNWKDYNASEICQVIEHSPFSDMHFVGDSFARNMFRTFSMMVTNDFDHGAVNASTPLPIRKRCTRMQQYFWKECRETLYNLSKTLNPNNLCGGRGYLNFSASLDPFYSNQLSTNFVKLVKSKIDVPGSLILVSIGFHMQCNSSSAIKHFLQPAIEAINQYYGDPAVARNPRKLSGRWPQIILCLPLSIGLLKPTGFLSLQNEVKCNKYCSEMKSYSRTHDIRVLDFRELSKRVYSFDGTHHGINVNRLKNLILLNYIASLS